MTTLPKTKFELDDIVRRATALRMTSLLPLLNNPDDHALLRRKLRGILPEYSLVIGAEKPIWLPTLSTRQHGKWRVYSNTDITAPNLREDFYLSYFSARDISGMKELYGRSSAAAVTATKMIRQFGDRWCVTLGRPAVAYKSATMFLQDLILIETQPSLANHPPAGKTGPGEAWKMGPYADEIMNQMDPVFQLGDEIVCTVSKHAI